MKIFVKVCFVNYKNVKYRSSLSNFSFRYKLLMNESMYL